MNCQILLYKKKKPSELEFTSLFSHILFKTSFRASIPCVHWVDKKLYRGWQSSAWSFLQDQWRLQKLTAIVFNWDHQAIIDQRPSQTPECTLIPGHSLHKQKQKLLGGKLGILSPQDWDPLTYSRVMSIMSGSSYDICFFVCVKQASSPSFMDYYGLRIYTSDCWTCLWRLCIGMNVFFIRIMATW